MKVRTAKWTSLVDGTSTDWASIPGNAMKLDIDAEKDKAYKIIVWAHLSRVQQTITNVNTEFRIKIGDEILGQTNTGNTSGWAFRAVEFHGSIESYTALHDEVHIQVEYRTQAGTVQFFDNSSGPQFRRLTATWGPA